MLQVLANEMGVGDSILRNTAPYPQAHDGGFLAHHLEAQFPNVLHGGQPTLGVPDSQDDLGIREGFQEVPSEKGDGVSHYQVHAVVLRRRELRVLQN